MCTLLFDLEPADVKGPLTNFQGTRFIREDFKRLVTTINSAAGDARLDAAVLEGVFEMWWPQLEKKVSQILSSHDKGSKKEKRSDRDILEELLELTRLSVRHPVRPHRISRHALMEIIEALYELTAISPSEHGEIGRLILRRIDRPLRRLSMEAGMPEAYEQMRMLQRRLGVESGVVPHPTDVSAKGESGLGE